MISYHRAPPDGGAAEGPAGRGRRGAGGGRAGGLSFIAINDSYY